jgi:hypothetical protein
MASGDPEAASDAAWAASGTMHAAAALLGSRVLREAADAYDRAARTPYARIPAPTQAGSSLRAAARLLAVLAFVSGDPSLRPVLLVARLAVLAEAVGRMRASQERAAQAAGALAAAQRMRGAVGEAQPVRVPGAAASADTTAGQASAGFPVMPGAAPGPSAAPPPRRPGLVPSRHPPRPRR